MKRVGNAQTIADIEFVIDAPTLNDPRHSWTMTGKLGTIAMPAKNTPGDVVRTKTGARLH